MSKHSVSKVVIVILALIAIVFAGFIFYGYGSIFPEIPLPEDKARLLRYLSCAYAICAKGCMNNDVIDILLDEGHGCYDHCSKIANERGISLDVQMCGKDFTLEFTFNRETALYSNTPKKRLGHLSMETDITKYLKGEGPEIASKWYDYIKGAKAECFGESVGIIYKQEEVTLDGRKYQVVCEHAGAIAGRYVKGLCEGMLRVGSSCTSESTTSYTSTGHIWIDPDIVDPSTDGQCDPFETNGYLGNCTFDGEQTIYIWSEADGHCPELVICSAL